MEGTRSMTLDRRSIFSAFFFGVFLFLIYQFFRLLSPFFGAFVVAIALALIFFPLHAAIRRRLAKWESVAAGVSTGLLLFMVIAPVALLSWLMIQQSSSLSPFALEKIQQWREAPSLQTLLPGHLGKIALRAQHFLASWEIDLQDILLKNLDQLGVELSTLGTRIVKNVFFVFFEVFITAFSLFFMFRDGEKIARWLVDLIPMESAHKDQILQRLGQTLSAVVRGIFVTAAVQGFLAGAGYALAGLRFSVFLGFGTAFAALIPLVGAVAVWLPVNGYLFMRGETTKGLILLVWNALVVSLADNVLKPYLIGEKAKLPVFLLFFGMLGGLQVYGPIGLLTGPLLIASALAFAKIYREQMNSSAVRPPERPPVARP
jgi:predicted PurR-regulated permease PerM